MTQKKYFTRDDIAMITDLMITGFGPVPGKYVVDAKKIILQLFEEREKLLVLNEKYREIVANLKAVIFSQEEAFEINLDLSNFLREGA